jgi:hypothetical protein
MTIEIDEVTRNEDIQEFNSKKRELENVDEGEHESKKAKV